MATQAPLPLQPFQPTTNYTPGKTWDPKVQLNEAGLQSLGQRLLDGHKTQVAAKSKAGLLSLSSSLSVPPSDPLLICLLHRNTARLCSLILPGELQSPSQRVGSVSSRTSFQAKQWAQGCPRTGQGTAAVTPLSPCPWKSEILM